MARCFGGAIEYGIGFRISQTVFVLFFDFFSAHQKWHRPLDTDPHPYIGGPRSRAIKARIHTKARNTTKTRNITKTIIPPITKIYKKNTLDMDISRESETPDCNASQDFRMPHCNASVDFRTPDCNASQDFRMPHCNASAKPIAARCNAFFAMPPSRRKPRARILRAYATPLPSCGHTRSPWLYWPL